MQKRHSSYVYDTETQFYYLQSRYYDPELGRFLNADALISTGRGVLGNNMFAYCQNNPVNKRDLFGYISYDAFDEDPNGDRNPLNDVAKIGTGSISRGTFRVRLIKLTGQAPANSDAHHIFPYSMSTKFSQLDIDVNNALYGSWVNSSAHRQFSYEYNQWWKVFFDTEGVTQGDAFALVEFLAALFGFDLHY